MKLKNLLEQGYYKKQRRNPAADEDSSSKSYKVSDDLDHIKNEIMMNIKGAYKEQADYIMNQIKGKIISFNLGRDEGVAEDVKVQMSNSHKDTIEIGIKIDGLWRELRSSIEIKDKEQRDDVFGENLEENNMKLKNLVEQMDLNDPALMRARASKDQFQAAKAAEKEAQRNRVYGKQREALEDELWDIAQDLRTAYADRRNLVIDMEQEAEPEGGDVASEYGSILNTLDAEIEALKKRRDAIEARLSI